MKKLSLLLLIFLTTTQSFATSIEDYINNTPSWAEDIKEIIYLSTRCSGILQVVGEHRRVVGDQEFGPALLKAGQGLGLQSAQLALDEGISIENIKERMIYWMKKYADDSISNTDNYNNIFVGDFANDFTTCRNLFMAPKSNRNDEQLLIALTIFNADIIESLQA